jgi:hypothetical protein
LVVITETRNGSRKPLGSTTSDREEDDCPLLKKQILNTGMLLTLQQPVYVRWLSKGRACMYACRLTAGHVHLYNFSKMKNNNPTNQTGSTGIEN